MSQEVINWDEDVAASPEENYQALVRAISWAAGFGLLFVRCSPAEGDRLISKIIQDIPSKKIEVLRLENSIDNLYDLVKSLPNLKAINVLFIVGIEKSFISYIKPGHGGQGDFYKLDSVPRVLGHLNLQRDRFRDQFPNTCFVFLVPFFGLKYFVRRAQDFFDWHSGVFDIQTEPDRLEQAAWQIVLEGDYRKYLSFTPDERNQKILEIQELLAETQNLNRKADLFFELGNLLVATQALDAAIASFDQALQIKPDYHELWYNRGYALGNLGRYEEAIASFDQALQIEPDDKAAWYNRGYALDELGRYEEAIASFDQALQIKPDLHKAWNNRGIALRKLGRYEEAIASYDQALQIKPDKDEAWNNRGTALGKLGRYEEAIASYDQALQIKPDKDEAWYNRGIALRKLGRYEEAIASYDQALHIKPNKPSPWYNKACCYGLQGNVELAVNSLQQAIQLNPEKYREMAKGDTDFDRIREDARFQALLGEVS